MSFQYDKLNITVLDNIRPILLKSAFEWTKEEYIQVLLFSAAISQLSSYSDHSKEDYRVL